MRKEYVKMVMICPYCDMEINEKQMEAEDGCCPECGAVITAGNVLSDGDDEFYDEDEDAFGDEDNFGDEDENGLSDLDEFEDEYGSDTLEDDFDEEPKPRKRRR